MLKNRTDDDRTFFRGQNERNEPIFRVKTLRAIVKYSDGFPMMEREFGGTAPAPGTEDDNLSSVISGPGVLQRCFN